MQSLIPANSMSDTEAWSRDLIALAVIVVLATALLPAWGVGWELLWPYGISPDEADNAQGTFADVLDQLATFYLLPAMGFALALRAGRVDLSVWAVAGLGGVIAATLINAGFPPTWSFVAAVGSGIIAGVLHGMAVMRTRAFSFLITLAFSGLWVLVARGIAPGEQVVVDRSAFSTWHLSREIAVPVHSATSQPTGVDDPTSGMTNHRVEYRRQAIPPANTRMLLLSMAYSVVMIGILGWEMIERRTRLRLSKRREVLVAMAVSGALSALAGAVWLIEAHAAPRPSRLIGDLRVPAAALLAGTLLLKGPRRTLLTGLLLPMSVLLATLWRQEVLLGGPVYAWGYAGQVLLLAAMVITCHQGFVAAQAAEGRLRCTYGALMLVCLVGMGITAHQVLQPDRAGRDILHTLGTSVWALGASAMVVVATGRWLLRRGHAHGGAKV